MYEFVNFFIPKVKKYLFYFNFPFKKIHIILIISN